MLKHDELEKYVNGQHRMGFYATSKLAHFLLFLLIAKYARLAGNIRRNQELLIDYGPDFFVE